MVHMGDCQNYGPFLGPYYNTGPNLGDLKRDHNFDNPPYGLLKGRSLHGAPFVVKRQKTFGVQSAIG